MRQNPIVGAFLALANVCAVLVAVYLAVDALDMSRRQSARVEQSLNRLSETLDRLGTAIGHLESVGARSGDDDRPALAARPGARRETGKNANFLNADLRDPDAEEGGSIVQRVQALPGNLNNIVNNEATLAGIHGLLNDSLAGRNNNDLTRYEPQLAESWDVSPDGLVYTIRLRRDAMWHPFTDPATGREGEARPVTAGDFLFYWETIQNPDIPVDHLRGYYEDLASVEVLDDHTFKVVWKRPYSMSEAFTLGMSPLPRHYYRPDPTWDDKRFAEEFIASPRNQWIVGTGPYKLSRWDKNLEVYMERNDAYYGPKPPVVSRHIRLIPDNSVSFLEFKRGEIDIYGLSPTQWHEETPEPEFMLVTPNIETAHDDSVAWDKRKKADELPDDYSFEKYQYNSTSWTYVGYNLQRPLFQDREVRVALTHLIDRWRILDEVYLGLGKIISGPFIPQSPYYNHDVEPIPFDIEAAKRILAERGWADTDNDGILDKDFDGSGERKPFRFTFIIPSSSVTGRKTAAIIEQDMAKAGIRMDIKPIEWSVYTELLNRREFDVCSLGWSGAVEGDPYQIWHGSGANREASSNHVGYSSPEADRLIEEGRRTVDKEKRYEIYRELHRVIAEDQPYTFLFAPTATQAQTKRLRNAIVYEGGMDTLLQWMPLAEQRTR